MGNSINSSNSTVTTRQQVTANQNSNSATVSTRSQVDTTKAKADIAKASVTSSQQQQSASAAMDDVLSKIDNLLMDSEGNVVDNSSNETLAKQLNPVDFKVANNNTHENWGGLGEKWIKNDQGEWHYMIKNEDTGEIDVYKWDSGTKAGMQNGEDTKVGTIGAEFFEDPNELGEEAPEDLFVTNNKTYDNWGGLGEKWLKNDRGEWHYMLKNEDTGKTDVFKWDSGTKEGMKNGEDTKVASLSSDYFDNPLNLGDDNLRTKRTTYQVSEQGTFDNYLGKGEKWIQNEVGEWHYMVLENEIVDPDLPEANRTFKQVAKLYSWDSASKEGSLAGGDSLVSSIDAKYFVDPSLLGSDPPQILFTASQEEVLATPLEADDIQTISQDEVLADSTQTSVTAQGKISR
jgi:hypothetical protein